MQGELDPPHKLKHIVSQIRSNAEKTGYFNTLIARCEGKTFEYRILLRGLGYRRRQERMVVCRPGDGKAQAGYQIIEQKDGIKEHIPVGGPKGRIPP